MAWSEFVALLAAIVTNSFALLSGLLGTAMTAYGAFTRQSMSGRIFLAFGLIALFLAPIAAWRDEHRELQVLRSEATQTLSLDFRIDNRNNQKILTIQSKGRSIEDLEVFAASFDLDPTALQKRRLRYTISKYGGPLTTIPRVSRQTTINLATILTLSDFPPQPGPEPHKMPPAYRTNYCLRMTFVDAVTKERLVHYELTSAVKGPSFVDRSAETAVAGGSMESWEFLLGVAPQLKARCRSLFEDHVREYN